MFQAKPHSRKFLNKFWASKSGGVIIYVAFGLPRLLGAMALSVDLGRAFILNTELKDFSDAAALAGAAELDGRDGARAAAEAAARTGISGTLVNIQAFATDAGGRNITIPPPGSVPPGIVFLKNLPADGTDFTAADTATTDAEARFIFVSVVNRSVRSGLSRALGVIPEFDTTARSIAGFQAVHCRIPAMMMCNPLEDNVTPFPTADLDGCNFEDLGVGAALKKECLYGRQMLMKTGGGNASYVPGDFGLLDCLDGKQGTNCVAPFVASAEPGYCVSTSANLRTGQAMGPVRTAINTRFDMYENPFFKKEGDNPDYRPALNVVKGHTGPKCNTSPETDPDIAMAYPKDKCFVENNCLGGRFGSGGWQDAADTDGDGIPDTGDRGQAYWNVNHPGQSLPTDYTSMTRFELYRHEIETAPGNPGIPDNSDPPPGDPIGENANPSCYSGGTLSDPTMNADPDDPLAIDRRKFTLAAINCLQYEVDTGQKLAGNKDNVPVIGFVDVFLTGPAEGTGNTKADIFAEVIGVSPPGVNGLKDIVQLYR
jgi:Flp pilus assembly protein TadG